MFKNEEEFKEKKYTPKNKDTVVWRTINHETNVFRSCHQSIYHKGYVYSFLGEGSAQFNWSSQVFKFNLSTERGVELPNIFTNNSDPPARRNHVCVKRGNYVYMYGGEIRRLHENVVYKFNLDTNEWKMIDFGIDDTIPSCRMYHCGCLCGNDIYFFGGEYLEDTQFDELWKLDSNEKWTNVLFNSKLNPSGRRYATLVSKDHYLYLFGGRDENERFNETWEFNTFNSCWKLMKVDGDVPKPRAGHTAVLHLEAMWIYGGNK